MTEIAISPLALDPATVNTPQSTVIVGTTGQNRAFKLDDNPAGPQYLYHTFRVRGYNGTGDWQAKLPWRSEVVITGTVILSVAFKFWLAETDDVNPDDLPWGAESAATGTHQGGTAERPHEIIIPIPAARVANAVNGHQCQMRMWRDYASDTLFDNAIIGGDELELSYPDT